MRKATTSILLSLILTGLIILLGFLLSGCAANEMLPTKATEMPPWSTPQMTSVIETAPTPIGTLTDAYVYHEIHIVDCETVEIDGVIYHLVGIDSLCECGTGAKVTSTNTPTEMPTNTPTTEPKPTIVITSEPTAKPTIEPTSEPTTEPTIEPTSEPTIEPTIEPTKQHCDQGRGNGDDECSPGNSDNNHEPNDDQKGPRG